MIGGSSISQLMEHQPPDLGENYYFFPKETKNSQKMKKNGPLGSATGAGGIFLNKRLNSLFASYS